MTNKQIVALIDAAIDTGYRQARRDTTSHTQPDCADHAACLAAVVHNANENILAAEKRAQEAQEALAAETAANERLQTELEQAVADHQRVWMANEAAQRELATLRAGSRFTPEDLRNVELGRLVRQMPNRSLLKRRDGVWLFFCDDRTRQGEANTPQDALRAAGIGTVDDGAGEKGRQA